MWYDRKRDMYLGYTSTGKCIAVTPENILSAIRGAIATKDDINSCLNPDSWCYLTQPDSDVYEIEQLEDTEYSLEDALDIAGKAVCELEDLVYACEHVGKKGKIKVTVSSEQCEDYTATYPNIAMLYASMQAQDYHNFQVFSGWQPILE